MLRIIKFVWEVLVKNCKPEIVSSVVSFNLRQSIILRKSAPTQTEFWILPDDSLKGIFSSQQ